MGAVQLVIYSAPIGFLLTEEGKNVQSNLRVRASEIKKVFEVFAGTNHVITLDVREEELVRRHQGALALQTVEPVTPHPRQGGEAARETSHGVRWTW